MYLYKDLIVLFNKLIRYSGNLEFSNRKNVSPREPFVTVSFLWIKTDINLDLARGRFLLRESTPERERRRMGRGSWGANVNRYHGQFLNGSEPIKKKVSYTCVASALEEKKRSSGVGVTRADFDDSTHPIHFALGIVSLLADLFWTLLSKKR